jgi:hypothetical protein
MTRIRQAAKSAWLTLREGLIPALGTNADSDDYLYRRLSSRDTKDLKPWDHVRQLQMAYYLWVVNPLARGIVETKKDYVVGDGLTIEAVDPIVQEVLDEFWFSPVNDWSRKIHSRVRELILYGEQIWPVFTQEYTGRIQLGYVDPVNVEAVVVDSLNCEVAIGVIVKAGETGKKIKLRVIQEEQALSRIAEQEQKKFTDGETFIFQINKLSNATRGLSDILPEVDTIDLYDRLQFTRAEKIETAGRYFFDCKIEGADEDMIKAFKEKEEAKVPKEGTTKFHNEKVTWSVIAPDLKAQDFSEDMRRLKNYILAGVRLPEHFFGDAGDANKATAVAMNSPVHHAMRSLQSEVEAIVSTVFRYVIHRGKDSGRIPMTADEKFTANFPEISSEDIQQHALAIASIQTALSQARMDEAITVDQEREILKRLIAPLGVELDFEDADQEIKDDAERSDAAPYLAAINA